MSIRYNELKAENEKSVNAGIAPLYYIEHVNMKEGFCILSDNFSSYIRVDTPRLIQNIENGNCAVKNVGVLANIIRDNDENVVYILRDGEGTLIGIFREPKFNNVIDYLKKQNITYSTETCNLDVVEYNNVVKKF